MQFGLLLWCTVHTGYSSQPDPTIIHDIASTHLHLTDVARVDNESTLPCLKSR